MSNYYYQYFHIFSIFIDKVLEPRNMYTFFWNIFENLIKNIILLIFRCVAWQYLNNCLRISVFMSVCFWKQMKFLSFNRFSVISLKTFQFPCKSNWFDLKHEILNFYWRQKMRFFIFWKYYKKIILRVAWPKYSWNIQILRILGKSVFLFQGLYQFFKID